MPALPTIVSDFLTKVKNDLSVGSDLATPGSGNIRGAAINYLRAQDMASVLELLQDALDQSTNLVAVSGSTTTVVDGASTFVAGAQIGNYVTFAGNTTAALAGVTARVSSNTTTTLTFSSILPASPAAGDTYTIAGGVVAEAIADLREGKSLGDAPSGSVYGESRIVMDALNRLTVQLGATQRERNLGRPSLLTTAGSTDTVVNIDNFGVPYRTDEFRGAKCVVGANTPRVVVQSTATTVTLNRALTAAPGAGVAVALTVAANQAHKTYGRISTHPGSQPGENIFLADLIAQAEAAVVAFTLPT